MRVGMREVVNGDADWRRCIWERSECSSWRGGLGEDQRGSSTKLRRSVSRGKVIGQTSHARRRATPRALSVWICCNRTANWRWGSRN